MIINTITNKMITLYAAFVEKIAKLKRAVAGGEILRKPLQIEKSFQKSVRMLANEVQQSKSNYLVAVAHHVMHRDQSFKDYSPICVLRTLYQEIGELRYGDIRLVGAMN